MNQILAIARKEFRAYFRSPVAFIFIGIFLAITLFVFFWADSFFRRNLADVRPLFHWLPLLMVFLVAALSMRLWSEEQRSGTLEVLLTLPVEVHRLVIGKFLAAWALIGISLALTLGLPITASFLGDLDWGPVIGGYLGAMLLAGAYLAIGLCLSSVTDNAIIALMSTLVGCGALYAVGSETVISKISHRGVEVLQAIGSGSRFDSIQRGVIDLRDLVYYASLTVGFVLLNVFVLKAKRWAKQTDERAARLMRLGATLFACGVLVTAITFAAASGLGFGRYLIAAGALVWGPVFFILGWTRQAQKSAVARRQFAAQLTTVLVVMNLLVLNLLIAPARAARVDLTARREYSISKVTKNLLRGLDAPLEIRGYFSAKTHELLAPLVPRIRDLVQEYAAVGGSKVRVDFVDPRTDPAMEKEANESFGVKSVPFQFENVNEAGIVNSYFTLLVKYGDKHELLNFQDLIEVKVTGLRDIEVKLRDLEYDLTRTIKKVVYGFQPLEEVFARAGGPVKLTAFITPKTLPKSFREIPGRLEKVREELAKHAGGRFQFETVDPSGEDKKELRASLYQKYGIKPLATSLLSEESFYLHLLLSQGDKREAIYPAMEMSEADLKTEITAALKRLTPGFLKTVGLLLPPPEQPQGYNPMMRRQPESTRRYEMLREKLSENYTVREVDLKDGRVPGEVDMLLLVSPQNLDEKQRFAVDQYLMRGGSVVVCTGAFQMDMGGPGGLAVKSSQSGLEEMLSGWGVTVQKALVLDPQNEAFPVPVERNVMGMMVRELQLVNYPFFVDVRQSGMAEDSLIVRGLPSVTLQWASPLEVKPSSGVKAATLLRSSKGSWTQTSASVQPDFDKYGEKGFGVEGETKDRALAVMLTGSFKSAYADKPSPLFKEEGDKQDAGDKKGGKADQTGRTIKQSPESARLLVVGSSEFVNDLVLNVSRQTGSERYLSNLQMVQNIADWSVADLDLLSIRSRGTYARTLKPMDAAARSHWVWLNIGLAALGLGLVVAISVMRRRAIQPLQLATPKLKEGE